MTLDQHITLAPVVCPNCGQDNFQVVAVGPDYENHCCGTQEFQLVQCKNCQTVYLNPRPTPDMLHRIYGVEDYYSYDFAETANPIVVRARERRDMGKIAQVLQTVGRPIQDLQVVDIGAGDGALLDSFHRAGVPLQQLTGVEIEQIAIDKYQSRGMRGILGQAETLDLPAESVDVFCMIQVIEHIANPKEVVKKLYSLLRPGGVFLIETPNFDAWDRRFFRRKTWGGYHFPRHWTLWSKPTMHQFLGDCGFEIALMQTPPAAVLWAWSINHVLQDKGASPGLQKVFGMNNPFVLALLLGLEFIPSQLGASANMRVIARKP